ncbi:hypothetical protein OKW27_003700 [Paraburkholderia sp. 35.1]
MMGPCHGKTALKNVLGPRVQEALPKALGAVNGMTRFSRLGDRTWERSEPRETRWAAGFRRNFWC